jgi:hypothetical protein
VLVRRRRDWERAYGATDYDYALAAIVVDLVRGER